MTQTIRVGIVGAGANTRKRHIPGLRAVAGVEVVGVCNRQKESTGAAAREFNIPRTFENWEALVTDPDIDAVMIGTWPYLHAPITLAALAAGKHVLTEARLSTTAEEAHRMLAAAEAYPHLVCQVVPSPFGLLADAVVKDLIADGYLGELREVQLTSRSAALADPAAPLSWRQDAALSGLNMLTLGILHESMIRWTPSPIRVRSQVHAFIPSRVDPASGVRRRVGTPDSVQVLAELAGGARAVYQFSGVTAVGGEMSIRLFGSEGVLHYDFETDKLTGLRKADAGQRELKPIPVPADPHRGWRVESDWIDSIRNRTPVKFTDFATGVAYMEFTEAVARSAESGRAVDLPLTEL